MLLKLLIFVVVTVNFLLGAGVFIRNSSSKENRWYAAFVIFLDLWILSNFLENEPSIVGIENLGLFLRLDFIFALVASYSWYKFSSFFTGSSLQNKKFIDYITTIIILFLAAVILGNGLVIKEIEFVDGVISFKDGILWPLYAITLLYPFVAATFILIFARRSTKKRDIKRRQINFVFFGFALSIGNALFINLFLQTFFPISLEVSRIGLYGMTFWVVFTAYAILKHRLLNISVIATELFILTIVVLLSIPLFEIASFKVQPSRYILNIFVFISVSVFGFLLTRSVKKEIGLRQEITTLAHSLEDANVRLQEIDRQKTEFLSIASHQLRTPLSIIKGYIELIEDGAYGRITAKTREILTQMDESNERLVKLVDDFLNISRIEQGRTRFSFSPDPVNDLVDSVYEELKKRAEDKGLKLIWKRNEEIKSVYMDSEKVRHVMFNYVDNAIKYSEKGKIEILLEKEHGGINYRVVDEGIGFEKNDQANFFTKFYRGENVKGTNVNGTGLGIFVCKQFIEVHHGKVWAQSEGLNKGSEFGFWIPERQSKEDVVTDLPNDKNSSLGQDIVNQYGG